MSWLDTLAEIRQKDWSQASEEDRKKAANDVVMMSSYAGAAASMVPIPLAEMAILIPVHSTMVMTVGHVYGRPVTKTEAKRVVVELGAIAGVSLAGRAAISALKKLVMPALGGVLAAPMSFAITWGLGRAATAYFQDPHLSRDELKKIFQDAVKEGKAAFSMETLEKFREKDDAEAEPEGTETSEEEARPQEERPSNEERPSQKERPSQEERPSQQERPSAAAQPDGPEKEDPEDQKAPESLRPKKRSL